MQTNHCNNVFGCLEEEQFERCTCYRDCGYDGEPVCGSDGQLYQNQCQMEVFACRNGTRIKQVPLSQCPHGKRALIAHPVNSGLKMTTVQSLLSPGSRPTLPSSPLNQLRFLNCFRVVLSRNMINKDASSTEGIAQCHQNMTWTF